MFHYLQYIFGKNEARKGNESEKMVSNIYVVILPNMILVVVLDHIIY